MHCTQTTEKPQHELLHVETVHLPPFPSPTTQSRDSVCPDMEETTPLVRSVGLPAFGEKMAIPSECCT